MPRERGGADPLGASLTFVASAAAFGAVGYWLDAEFDTLPAFLLVGLLVGFVGGFIHLLAAVAPDMLPFRKQKGHSKNSKGSDVQTPDDQGG